MRAIFPCFGQTSSTALYSDVLLLAVPQYFLQNQIAMSDPNNRVRSQVMAERRADNIDQLVGMWGNDPPPPDNEARRSTPNSRKPFWTFKPG